MKLFILNHTTLLHKTFYGIFKCQAIQKFFKTQISPNSSNLESMTNFKASFYGVKLRKPYFGLQYIANWTEDKLGHLNCWSIHKSQLISLLSSSSAVSFK